MSPSDTSLDTQTLIDLKATTVNITGSTETQVKGGDAIIVEEKGEVYLN